MLDRKLWRQSLHSKSPMALGVMWKKVEETESMGMVL
jgi:hypothetical protein